MITFFLVGLLVYQNADTLQFTDQDSVVDIIILEDEDYSDSLGQIVVRRGRVSEDHMYYLIYEAVQAGDEEVVHSKISFYDAGKNLLWEELGQEGRNISYDFSGIYDGILVVTIWDRLSSDPSFFVVKDGEKVEIIEEGEWQQLLDYRVSPNGQYFLFYTRNPRNGKTWDYLYFYDLGDRRDWDYLFPICMSCKRGWVDINVDDDGRSEAIYKGEHRIFSRGGVLEEIFMKLQ
ncbi:MAG: hypothetical protein OEV79_03555 [candidate division WOR-3 bacterium]|nr:hypothetical protein [candidate division WOR-3 bacterium]